MTTATLLAILTTLVMVAIVTPLSTRDWGAIGCALFVAWLLYKIMEYLDSLDD
jgi:hypothetical protein